MLQVIENSAVGRSFGSELFIPEPSGVVTERIRDARIQLSRRILTDSRSRVTVTADVIQGPVSATITAYAGDADFDLIVMGTRGRGGFAHVFMGSIAESVIRTAPCPVLTVKSPHADQVRTTNADAA
jgi:nucleotide-binding universal stress UspA family protein